MRMGSPESFDMENLRCHDMKRRAIRARSVEANAREIRRTVDDRCLRIGRACLSVCLYAFERDRIALSEVVCGKAGRHASRLPWAQRHIDR